MNRLEKFGIIGVGLTGYGTLALHVNERIIICIEYAWMSFPQ